ncbi:MAG: ABC transporter permease [bacterium]|nr:ABC transporter permease [bacterium]
MSRALTHYWRIHLAVVLGAAVATAVLTGALIVGDSVKGSLRALTLERLGGIDSAMIAQRFFRESLVRDLEAHPRFAELYTRAAPAITVRGSVAASGDGSRAGRVGIHGIDERFLAVHGSTSALDLGRRDGQLFPSVVINDGLARQLGVASGDSVVLSFGRWDHVPRETLMGEKDPEDVLGALRATVVEVLPDEGLGRFGLLPAQQTPLVAFVPLEELQEELEQEGSVNTLFLTHASAEARADSLLRSMLTLEDLGFVLRERRDHFVMESLEFVLRPNVDDVLGQAAEQLDAPLLRVQSYLANRMSIGEHATPYSMVAALDAIPGRGWASLVRPDGHLAPEPSDRGILLNTWTAEDLGAKVGDELRLDYFEVDPQEQLIPQHVVLRVEGIVAMQGLGADRELVPDYPGIQDTDDMADWDPPFPVDLDAIRDKDEDYWDRHAATPKAFVSEGLGARLWETRYGTTTLARVGAAPDMNVAQTRAAVERRILDRMQLEAFGLRFEALKDAGLHASRGATDFSGLFIGFSLFLIVSSAMLVALLFSLGVEQRAREVGLLLALGYPLRSVRRRLLGEGALLALVGAVLGLACGVGYAELMMLGLRTIWQPAVGSSRLFLHVTPQSLFLGFAIALIVILFAVALTLRRLRRLPPPALLAGVVRPVARPGGGRVARVLAFGGGAVALGMAGFGIAVGSAASPGIAMAGGALLLVSGLALFNLWCRGKTRALLTLANARLAGMAARNSSWNPGRSILSVALVASASFVIVLVGAFRHDPGHELRSRDSGSGGFALLAESDVPLYQNLNDRDGRSDLGFAQDESASLEPVAVYPFRVEPGDDASCLNLYRPEKPRVLGVGPELIARGGFGFQQHLELPEGVDNPWALLQQDFGPGVIPAIGDANSVQWILHMGFDALGKEFVMQDELGDEIRLRLVGLLARSVFQSELLIPEGKFLEHFPSRGGYSYFLIDAEHDTALETGRVLESRLGDHGFDATTTGDRLAGYLEVEHTYISTFQTLGALGLLLGTVGLAIVLLRNVIERRGELATLRAFGFRRSSLGWMVVAENAFLLVVGIGVGTIAALVAVAPLLSTVHVPWAALGGTLVVILIVGMLSAVAAVAGALRVPLLPALKAER